MAIDKPEIVDAVGLERGTGFVVLTITDEWDWKNEGQHLLALQAKLNAYFHFVESGQLRSTYSEVGNRKVVIDVVSRFAMPQVGLQLLERSSIACADLGIRVRNKKYPC